MQILHINLNYVGTRLFQGMMKYLDYPSTDSIVFVPICSTTEINIIPDEKAVIINCFNKRDRYLYHIKQKKIFDALKKSINIDQIDLCHAYTVFSDGNSAYKLKRKKGIPYITTVRDTDVNVFLKKMFWLRPRGRAILINADAIIFLAPAYRDLILNKYIPSRIRNAIAQKSYIIPNGIDVFWHEHLYFERDYRDIERRIEDKKIKLVFVGLLNFRKNIMATLSAIEILQRKGWSVEFTVVGKIVDEEVYKKVCDSKSTTYMDEQDKEGVMKQYRKNDIFVMPSIRETFGLTYAEAMSQGLPVIYSKGQGFDRQFNDGEIGYAVEAVSPEDIAGKIEMICKTYRRISMNCIAGSQKFDWSIIAEQYRTVYNSIIANCIV